MNVITCTKCGEEIEIDKALEGQIEARVLASERHKHADELAQVKAAQERALIAATKDAQELAQKRLAGERELLERQAAADLELERKRMQQELANAQRKESHEQAALVEQLRIDAQTAKEESASLREDLRKMMEQLREERKAKENAELSAQRKLAQEESKIREEAHKEADERERLKLAEKDKQLEAAKRQVEEMQRKLNQGSQQMQGEILELDLEEAFSRAFKDDRIDPVAKGVNGADISHVVRSQSGIECGTILWEIKRTKNWTAGWVSKLKEDLRHAKANVPVIITEALPKEFESDMGQVDGVWVVKPKLAIVLATLLRKALLDAARERTLAQNRGDKAGALYTFVTSHEFAQQLESMVETYQEMTQQVVKERVAYEKMWSLREKQAQRLLMSTANIVGSMQGYIGQASMPKIKGLDIDLEEADVALALE